MTIYSGKDIDTYRMVVIKNAMRLYLDTGMKANRAYTPAAMIRVASMYTGKSYKRNQLALAYQDLSRLVDVARITA